jgi:hypothetical protein
VGADSPGYATVNYYAALLQSDSARQRIETVLKQQALPGSSRNLFLQARFTLISDWAEFLKYAPRVPAGEIYDEGESETDWKGGALLDDDSVAILNQAAPLSRWIEAAKSPALPAHVRNEVVAAAWTRAILLGKSEEARTLA